MMTRGGGADERPTGQGRGRARRFAELDDLVTRARSLADDLGEPFLAYLLAMAHEDIRERKPTARAPRADKRPTLEA